MAHEHTPFTPPPASSGTPPVAPPGDGITDAPLTDLPNGVVREPAIGTASAEHRSLRSVGQTLWELVWPPTGNHLHQTESVREVVETVVFVVVLVLMLKSFAAEAFVIPTGSMAETLWGYQKVVQCPECGYLFPVNCSSEVDPQNRAQAEVVACTCPNCRKHIETLHTVDWSSGDRVLVAKSLYDTYLMRPERHDVVVFKFPGNDEEPGSGPQKDHIPMNYIKRLIGLGGETIGIWYGKLYVMIGDEPDAEDLKEKPQDLWRKRYTHPNKFHEELEKSDQVEVSKRRFHIIRKRPDKVLALKRIVYDNDHQAKDLASLPRWLGEEGSSWTVSGEHGFKHDAEGNGTAWLRYRHVLRNGLEQTGQARPQLITDFMGYNSFETNGSFHVPPRQNWVGDLILECEVTVEQPAGELVLELAKGVDRFRTRWDLNTGICSLLRLSEGQETLLDTKATAVKQKGTYRLRFANVDDRLLVWVNSSLPFEDGVPYEAASKHGPTAANDLQPASIGVKSGAVKLDHLKLWRDTYYTLHPGGADADLGPEEWSDPGRWQPLRELAARTMFVQPGHYLCMGDNSPESSDGRSWGLVPDRLLLGRALLVYYPFYCPVPPLKSPVSRWGAIR